MGILTAAPRPESPGPETTGPQTSGPELRPFRALRYDPAAGDPADLLCPPYDVIDPAAAEALRARGPYNAVRLERPEGGDPARAEAAAARLAAWRRAGILVRDAEPAAFLYRQTFQDPEGATRDRRSLLAALRLAALDAGRVLPHEETHGEPKRDRLALTLACRAQLSPIFLLAPDRGGALRDGLAAAEEAGPPALDARTPDGIRHRLWRVSGAPAGALCATAGAAPLLIADGHHRYETALAVADALPDSEAARWTLACVASERDPGLLLLPTHRALRGPPAAEGWRELLREAFEVGDAGGAGDRSAAGPPGSEGARGPASRTGGALVLRREGARPLRLVPRPEAIAAAGLSAAEARLGAVVFDRLVLRHRWGRTAQEASTAGLVSYHRDPAEALAAAGPDGAAFLVGPMRVSDVRGAVAAGGRLPPKTTYFAPKIPSGLVFRLL